MLIKVLIDMCLLRYRNKLQDKFLKSTMVPSILLFTMGVGFWFCLGGGGGGGSYLGVLKFHFQHSGNTSGIFSKQKFIDAFCDKSQAYKFNTTFVTNLNHQTAYSGCIFEYMANLP